jgi:hypothetical protein
MDLSVRVEPKPGYLHAFVTGENTRESVEAYMKAVAAACEKRKCRAVLIEEDLKGPSLGVAEMYGIVAAGAEVARLAFNVIAYVDVNPEHDRDLLKFAETVAVNRAVRLRLFRSVAEAERWLEDLTRT